MVHRHQPGVTLRSDMCFPDTFDFSGSYAFISTANYHHRLDESIRPLLEERGGRVIRIYTDKEPGAGTDDFCTASLPAGFFSTHHIRAAFTTDLAAPPDCVPSHIPLIALPHAFWFPTHTDQLLQRYSYYISNADYYLVQDSARLPHPCPVPASIRRKKTIHLLPFGSLKLDALRRSWHETRRKTAILYSCGKHGHGDPLRPEEKEPFITYCLQHFPQYDFILRPFPGDRHLYTSLAEHFRGTKFRIDSSKSTLRHLPSAAALLCDYNSTVGKIFSLATGQPVVFLGPQRLPGSYDPGNYFSTVRTPADMLARLQDILALQGQEVPELSAMREKYIFRPGSARELFFTYLSQILSGSVPGEAVAVNCEYIGAIRLPSPADEIAFFLRMLRACRLEFYWSLSGRFSTFSALLCFYSRLYHNGILCQKPALLSVSSRNGKKRLVIMDDKRERERPFRCVAPLSDYAPSTRTFIQQHEELRRTGQAPHESVSLLLPDRNQEVFCHALADVMEQVYMSSSPLPGHN